MIYLDTHVAVWLHAGLLTKIPEKAKNLLNTHEIRVSPIVDLELEFLFSKGKINHNSEEIINDLYAHIGVDICTLPYTAIVKQAKSIDWTFDPFDRLIVANAKLNESPLLTKD